MVTSAHADRATRARRVEEPAELRPATDHRHARPPLPPGASGVPGQQPPGAIADPFPFTGAARAGLGDDRRANEGKRPRAEQDLVRGGRLLETGGEVYGVAGYQALGRAGHHFAGVHTDASGQARPVLARELVVEGCPSLAQLDCRPRARKASSSCSHGDSEKAPSQRRR